MFAAHEQHSAGCHDSRPMTPSPAQTNYQCCVNGHHWATVSSSFSIDQVIPESPFDQLAGNLAFNTSLQADQTLVSPSDSPPGLVPLRI